MLFVSSRLYSATTKTTTKRMAGFGSRQRERSEWQLCVSRTTAVARKEEKTMSRIARKLATLISCECALWTVLRVQVYRVCV